MARLFLFNRQRGEYGHLDNTTITTETRDKFNVQTELSRIYKKTIVCYAYAASTPTSETHYLWNPTDKVKLLAAKLIPSNTLAAATDNYLTYTLRKGTTAIATAVTTSATTVTAGTPIDLTLTAAQVSLTADVVVNLLVEENSTVTKVVHMNVQFDYEEAK